MYVVLLYIFSWILIGDKMKALKTNTFPKKSTQKSQANKAAHIPADEKPNLWEQIFSNASWGCDCQQNDLKIASQLLKSKILLPDEKN